jgi:hypothetical protein
MKRNVLIFGSVAGAIICANMLWMVRTCYTNPEMLGNEIMGYAVMLITFSLTFFGIKNYRDRQLGGRITFGRALGTGSLIVLTAGTMYVLVWIVAYYFFVPDFLDRYAEHVMKDVPPSQVAATAQEMESFRELYKNPLYLILFTYAEVLPVGLIVALISSLILKRRAPKNSIS